MCFISILTPLARYVLYLTCPLRLVRWNAQESRDLTLPLLVILWLVAVFYYNYYDQILNGFSEGTAVLNDWLFKTSDAFPQLGDTGVCNARPVGTVEFENLLFCAPWHLMKGIKDALPSNPPVRSLPSHRRPPIRSRGLAEIAVAHHVLREKEMCRQRDSEALYRGDNSWLPLLLSKSLFVRQSIAFIWTMLELLLRVREVTPEGMKRRVGFSSH